MAIRLLLAEDMHMIRGALVALLELEGDLEVVAQLDRGDHIVETAVRLEPDVALIDVNLPGVNGLTAAAELRTVVPSCAVLMLTALHSPAVIRRAMEAQVSGFLLKDDLPADLVRAIRLAAAGQRVINPDLAAAAWMGEPVSLTRRELDVLQLAANGAGPSQIAEELHLSAGTVRNYLTVIVHKLNARNRLDAVRIARDAGWLR
ncbi:response regulator transcription factor [Micromonospora sp. NPDC002296]|uniref:response regulator transcription factor n=1 Tax=Micromonospora sp. NPDC002296 TaxID=3154271 RepID=UPI003318417E